MPTTVIGASYYGTLRARNGSTYTALAVLAGELPFTFNIQANECFMSYGPGATPAVPGTRLYWTDFASTVRYTDGATVAVVPGAPSTLNGFYFLYYDRERDRLYASYDPNGAGSCTVEYFDGSSWTSLGTTGAIAAEGGVLSVVPTSSLLRAGQPIVGCDIPPAASFGGVRCWDGAAWVTEVSNHATVIPYGLVPYGDRVILCNNATRTPGFTAADPLVQIRAADGTWTDITPSTWQPPNVNATRQATCAAVVGSAVYVQFRRNDNTRNEIWRFEQQADLYNEATDWTLSLDLVAEGTAPDGYVWSLAHINDTLHCGMDELFVGNYYLSLPDGGAWQRNTLPENLQPPFVESSIQFFLPSLEGTIAPTEGNASGEYGPQIAVHGYWDSPQFVPWVGATWTQTDGLWRFLASTIGSMVYLGHGIAQYRDDPLLLGSGAADNTTWCGEVAVVDPFVLTCQPPNGKGLASLSVSNTRAPGYPLLPIDANQDNNFPFFLEDGYTFQSPVATALVPSSGVLDGGTVVVVQGAWLYANLIEPSHPANRTLVTNRYFVRTSSGQVEEIPPASITFVAPDEMHIVMPPYPGGSDPAVEVIFAPAGLSPFWYGLPVGISPSWRFARSVLDYTYTGLDPATDLAILGSLATVLGLGADGGDIAGADIEAADDLDGGGGMRLPAAPGKSGCIASDDAE